MQTMKALINIIVYISLTISFSTCKNHLIDKAIDQKALKVINAFDSNSIKLFHDWNYGTRDTNILWIRISGDSQLYSCSFYKYKEFSRLEVFEPFGFISDFPSTYSFDTTRFWRFSFSNRNDTIFNIRSTLNLGNDLTHDTLVTLDKLFPRTNPFKKFDSLSSLIDSLNINAISYRENIGNFIQFRLTFNYELTYLPSNLFINPKFKQPWLDNFKKGTYLTSNWNLRKLLD